MTESALFMNGRATRWAARAAGAGLTAAALAGALASAPPASASVGRTCATQDVTSGGRSVLEVSSCAGETGTGSSGQAFAGGDTDTFPGVGYTGCSFKVSLRDDTKGTTIASNTFSSNCTENFANVVAKATAGHRYHAYISVNITLSNGVNIQLNDASNVINSPDITAN